MTIDDVWLAHLASLGFTSGTVQDRQRSWLEGMGYTGPIQQMMYNCLGTLGYEGTLQDRERDYLIDLAYAGNTLRDDIFLALDAGAYVLCGGE